MENQKIDKTLEIANQYYEQNNLVQAKELLNNVLKIQPGNLFALNLIGIILNIEGNYDLAIINFNKALKIDSNYIQAWSNKGNALCGLKNYIEAINCYDHAIKLNPDYVYAWSNKGNLLSELQRYTEAVNCYDQAIKLNPKYAYAWFNKGNALTELKSYQEAITCIDRAIALNPNYAEPWLNKGNVFNQLQRYEEAIASYDQAIKLNPKFEKAWSNRGNILTQIGKFSLAIDNYREATRLNPEFYDGYSNLLFCLNYINFFNPKDSLSEAKKYGEAVSLKSKPKFSTWNINSKDSKLKIGFVSGDLNKHPVGYCIEGIFEHLDQNKFEIYAFPTRELTDDLTDRIKNYFKEWIPIYGKSDLDAATIIHEKGIHILFDLSGHSGFNRLPVFSYKPAPVQISWLGYFATTGLPEMDYFFADPRLAPPSEKKYFTEKIWSLDTWFIHKPHSQLPKVSTLPVLKNGFLTLGCFNNLSKINNEVVKTWAAILKNLPNSKMLIKSKQLSDPKILKNFQQTILKHKISDSQIILEKAESRENYFKTYNKIDIILDTFPYPGGVTSLDALCMGVPVVTLKGYNFLSRFGETIAISSGLNNWIANDIDDYVQKTVRFASDTQYLSKLRSSLRDQVLKSPLFDTVSFAKKLGDTMIELWKR